MVSVVAFAIMMFVATPASVLAARSDQLTGAEAYITGPTSAEKGSTTTYEHWNVQHYMDGTSEAFSNSVNFPQTVSWSIASAVAPGTTLTYADGYGVLNVAADETADAIQISSYDSHFNLTSYITVYLNGNGQPAPAPVATEASSSNGNAAPSDADPFWLGVHTSLTNGAKSVTVNADGYTFVPAYVLDALRGKNATLTITCGLDNYVISGRNMGNLRSGANYSFGNLAEILNAKSDPNSRGGVTYSTQK